MTHNYDEFVNILPFDTLNNVLGRDVLSDHSEIGLEFDTNKYLLSWNISNPKYHPYFKNGPTFQKSHLYEKEPYVNGKLIPQLEEKVQKHLDVFKKNIDSGKFPIQIIIEGFDDFYKRLENIFVSYPNINYSLIRFCPTEENFTSNISGILVDTNMFEVLESGIESITYTESEDDNKTKTTLYPFVRVCCKYTREICIVIAVHVSGCSSQYPKSGIESLKNFMVQLHNKYQNNIIAIGDFNTPPAYIKKICDIESFNILAPDYLTHCNPHSQASKYDVAITYPKSYSLKTMDSKHLSNHSLSFIDSINKAIIDG